MRENIEFGIGSGIDPDMEEEERIKLVEAAATQAQLMGTVNSMPNGLNTMIGDRSEENLSDGQTQRLSLARGFLKDSEMMMLDEPTSALDPVMEQRIVDAIRQRLARGGRMRGGGQARISGPALGGQMRGGQGVPHRVVVGGTSCVMRRAIVGRS